MLKNAPSRTQCWQSWQCWQWGSAPALLLLLTVSPAAAQTTPPALRVVSAAPNGEVATLAEANEIRVVFSEPMVTAGRIPARVLAPFFRVTPAIPGTFRWSGTTILIFTPDPTRPLPYATRYEVDIDATAAAVSGRRLAKPHGFSFTTPTVRLLNTSWYRRGDRAGAQMVILLRFNQPVRPPDVAPHVAARFEKHPWEVPVLPAEGLAQLKVTDPSSVQRFNAKVAATSTVAGSTSPIGLRLASDWDKKQFPPSRDLVVFETTTEVAPEAWVRIGILPTIPSPAGAEKPPRETEYIIKVEHAFFVNAFHCTRACPADVANRVTFRVPVKVDAFAPAVLAAEVTSAGQFVPVAKASTPRPRPDFALDEDRQFSLEDAGFDRQPPARTFSITIASSLRSADGQTLGYTWAGAVENWHERAFTSFGDGHGVWERSGGMLLPFYARNMRTMTQWSQRVALPDLMPTIVRLQQDGEDRTGPAFSEAPVSAPIQRTLGVTPDRIQSHGIDLAPVLGAGGGGLVWAAIREGDPIERAERADSDGAEGRVRSTLVQVTNLGLTVKDSPQNTLVFVTRLDTGAPVSAAKVSIVNRRNETLWTGTTGADGLALAPKTPGLRDPERWWRLSFMVTAEKDGDVAYIGSDWNEGITPWAFGLSFDLDQSQPMLRGTVFTDRGVYRLGEEVRLKAILRHNTPQGIRLLPSGARVLLSVRDGQNRLVTEGTVAVNAWSSAEWAFTLPTEGSLGGYSIRAILESDKPVPKKPEDLKPGDEPGPALDDEVAYEKAVHASFLVAAYRRPDFRVDVKLTTGALKAGDPVKAAVSAKYLFGAPMPARPTTWTWTRSPGGSAPRAVYDALPDGDRWEFVGSVEPNADTSSVMSRETKTSRTGELNLDLTTQLDAGIPNIYTLEADVEDVSRQHIANRASITVHPADWYIGVRRPNYFLDQKAGLKTELIAISPSGEVVPGVPIEIKLTQVQWNSVRRAEGNGLYTWETEKKLVPAGSWTITSGLSPVAFEAPLPNGGYFELQATARQDSGRYAVTTSSFYALGAGYTAWERFDHNRIELVADKARYKPGDTARIMIQSPWERATAVVTTEREGIRSHRQFTLSSTQQSVTIPVTDDDIPNLYVSVLLIKGRGDAAAPAERPAGGPFAIEDSSDPGKPAFRLGYVELKVEDANRRLTVAVAANREEYRPATNAQVRVKVTDPQGKPVQSEVTLWAVDYGVLSLTAYRTPDVLGSVYVHKALQVMTADSRQRIVSRRVLTPKGETEGGGGGVDGGAMRKDFRVLAFWVGSVATNAGGEASIDVKLPESLTTYRIMAVAADRASRFGNGDAEVRVNKPLTMKPTFPRFLAVGDKALFGAVVTSQLREPGDATVTIRSLDPELLVLDGPAEQTLGVSAGGSVEARFAAAAKAVGRARVQMTVKLANETDSFEDIVPVEVLASPETVAAYGQLGGDTTRADEALTIPQSVVPGFGGLHLEMSSTAMVGLSEGARYLVEYPYGCAEQKGSRALAMVLAADLGDAFSLPGVDTAKMRPAVQKSLKELELFQCANGGFTYWPGQCRWTSPYLTSYLLHVFKVAADLNYDVDRGMQQRAYSYLERELALPPPTNESWWPAYTAWQAFAVKVMVEGGRNQDSPLTRLYGYRDRMPVFALAFLHDALMARGEKAGPRVDDLRRRMANAILPEAGSAHVEELSDPYLLWYWNSNVRSTAIVLNSLVKASATPEQIRPIVRWMMAARKNGRWGNTQENAHAMESLVAYYRRYEPTVPDFTGVAMLGERVVAREQFKGRSTQAATRDVPMADLARSAPAGTTRPLTFTRDGAGTLFYTARLRYASDALFQQGLDNGIRIERAFTPYVEKGTRPAQTTFKAGDLITVTLTLRLTKERRFVAVTDPLPAGFEPLESWFATTARSIGTLPEQDDEPASWETFWERGGFDHVERHDDRIQLFATRLAEGRHQFTYVVRATTAGTFRTAPARAEEMYEPEVFGRTATAVITVQR
jgi:alpha-2-macroglobulin